MKKFLLTIAVLALSCVAVIGCRVEGEVDDQTSVTSPR
jgi:hypothetical protein